jgi:natural product biosynthesis luciferase-like monooxygenase protein
MKFGLLYLPTFVPELDGGAADLFSHMLDQICLADDLGYHAVWLTEHHFHRYGGLVPNPAVFGAAIAVRTRRIRIGVAVSVLPLHQPMTVAEDYAMLDVLSRGRLEFGIGKGSVQDEYRQLAMPTEDAAAVFEEASELIARGWSTATLTHTGSRFQFPELTLLPRPVQQPHPPIWVGVTGSRSSFEWAGRHGYHLMVLPYLVPTDVLKDCLAVYFDALCAAGHDPARQEILAKFHVFVADSAAEARRLAAPAYENYQDLMAARTRQNCVGPVWDEHVAAYKVIAGSPEECIERIRHWRETLGITQIGGTFHFGGLAQEPTLRSIELFAREVEPAFREPEPLAVPATVWARIQP